MLRVSCSRLLGSIALLTSIIHLTFHVALTLDEGIAFFGQQGSQFIGMAAQLLRPLQRSWLISSMILTCLLAAN